MLDVKSIVNGSSPRAPSSTESSPAVSAHAITELPTPRRKENVTMSGLIGQYSAIDGRSPDRPAERDCRRSAADPDRERRSRLLCRLALRGRRPRQRCAVVGLHRRNRLSPRPDRQGVLARTDQRLVTQAGTTPEKFCTVLAQALPHAVDHVTPGGQVPAPDAIPVRPPSSPGSSTAAHVNRPLQGRNRVPPARNLRVKSAARPPACNTSATSERLRDGRDAS